MSNPNQPNLNGAYYGPPVPPQHYTSHSIPRHSSCGPCCLISTLLKSLISIIVILGIAVLVFWIVFRPNHIKVYIPQATLTQFNLTDTNNLQYNLSLTTTFRNPNRHIGIYYDLIDARALYAGSGFGYTPIPAFYQDHKSTTSVQSDFSGSGVLLVGDGVATTYKREKGEGYYYVEVKMYARLRLKVWFVRVRVRPEIDCMLKLPVPGSSNARFEGTKCHIDYI